MSDALQTVLCATALSFSALAMVLAWSRSVPQRVKVKLHEFRLELDEHGAAVRTAQAAAKAVIEEAEEVFSRVERKRASAAAAARRVGNPPDGVEPAGPPLDRASVRAARRAGRGSR